MGAVATLLVAAVFAMSARVVGAMRRRVDVDVARMAVMVMGDPAVVDPPVCGVEALPTPPVPVVVRATPVVVRVVASPTSVRVPRAVVIGSPPVNVWSFEHTPVA